MVESEAGLQGRDAPVADWHPAGPAPEPSPDSEAWWEGLRAHRVMLERCTSCGRIRFPPMPSCPWCASGSFDMVESSCLGTVYSFVTVHAAVSPGAAAWLPYTVATVQLDDGPRMVGRVQPNSDTGIGDRVRPRFVDHPEWTELCFELVPAEGDTGPRA